MPTWEAHIDGEGGYDHPHAGHRTFDEVAEAIYDYSGKHARIGALLTVINSETGGVRYWCFATTGLQRLTPAEAARHMTFEGWALAQAAA